VRTWGDLIGSTKCDLNGRSSELSFLCTATLPFVLSRAYNRAGGGRLPLIGYPRRLVIGGEKCPTTRQGLRRRPHTLCGVGTAMTGLTLAAVITFTVALPSAPTAADQMSSLKAQATQIAQDLVLA
jgi:hypothetical protein